LPALKPVFFQNCTNHQDNLDSPESQEIAAPKTRKKRRGNAQKPRNFGIHATFTGSLGNAHYMPGNLPLPKHLL
jgi:hypothetical protein